MATPQASTSYDYWAGLSDELKTQLQDFIKKLLFGQKEEKTKENFNEDLHRALCGLCDIHSLRYTNSYWQVNEKVKLDEHCLKFAQEIAKNFLVPSEVGVEEIKNFLTRIF
jgi:hypothetical protein